MTVLNIIKVFLFRLWPVLIVILVLWVIYWALKKNDDEKDTLPPWQTKLWLYTFGTAMVALILSVIIMIFQFDQNPDDKYIPAHMEDGKLVPGRISPDEASE